MSIEDQNNLEQKKDEGMSTSDSGDEKELEQYGVWIKTEPEDYEDTESQDEDEYNLQDLDLEEESMEEPSLTEEEEQLLGDLEEDQEEFPAEENIFGDIEAPGDEDADELSDFEFDLDEEPLESSSPESTELNVPETEKTAVESLEEEISAGEDELIEIPLDFVEEPAEAEETATLEEEELSPLGTIESENQNEEEFLEEIEEIPAEESLSSFDETTLPSADDELDNIDLEEIQQSDFGEDLPELELEENGLISESESEKELQFQTDTQSASILIKIEKELLAIKDELSSLKKELSVIKSSEVSVPEEESKEDSAGFFDEEEDETIALTGDELDNILNTAEFTEEMGEATDLAEEDIVESVSDDIASQSEEPAAEELESSEEEIEGSAEETLTGDELDNILNTAEFTEENVVQEDATQDDFSLMPSEEDLLIEEPEPSAASVSEPAEKSSDLTPVEGNELIDEIEVDIPDDLPPEEISFEDFDSEEDIDLITEHEETIKSESPSELEEELSLEEEPAESVEELSLEEEPDELPEEISLEEDLTPPEEELSLEEEITPLEEEELSLEEEPDELPEEISLEEDLTPPEEELSLEEEITPLEEEQPQAEEITESGEKGESYEKLPESLRSELKSVLSYMDQLLESLPEDKIQEFARSEHFEVYKKLFEELELGA